MHTSILKKCLVETYTETLCVDSKNFYKTGKIKFLFFQLLSVSLQCKKSVVCIPKSRNGVCFCNKSSPNSKRTFIKIHKVPNSEFHGVLLWNHFRLQGNAIWKCLLPFSFVMIYLQHACIYLILHVSAKTSSKDCSPTKKVVSHHELFITQTYF